MRSGELAVVAVGGAAGSLCRWLAVQALLATGAPPWACTATVNVVGAAGCGLLAGAWMQRAGAGWRWRGDRVGAELLLVGGFFGGLTTLSTLADDAAVLWLRGDARTAILDLALHAILGCFACASGFLLARRWLRGRYSTP